MIDSLNLTKSLLWGFWEAFKLLWPLLLLAIVLNIAKKILKKRHKTSKRFISKTEDDIASYKGKYRAQPIISARELNNFNTMVSVTRKLGLHIFAKVRLADVITPKISENEDKKEFYRLFNKINKKHCDFVIYDSRMRLIAVIEIDDGTHYKPDRKNRYDFTDFVFEDCGIKMLHYTNVDSAQFERDLKESLPSQTPSKATTYRSDRF